MHVRSAPLAVLAAVTLTVAAMLVSCSPKPDIVIGFAASLTGSDYLLGSEGRNAARLFVRELNAGGGIEGRKLRLEVRDYASDNAALPAVLGNLASAGAVAVVGAYTSSSVDAALPVLEGLGLPLISPAATATNLSGKEDLFFRTIMSSERDPLVLADLMRERNLGRALVVYSGRNLSYAEAYIAPLRSLIAVVDEISFLSVGDIDFTRVERARSGPAGYQAVVIVASPLDTGTVAQELATRGLSAPLFISGWAGSDELFRAGGSAVDGALFVHQVDPGDPALDGFRKRYAEAFSEAPGYGAIETWDSLLFLAEALRLSIGKGISLREALSSIRSFEGAAGAIAMDAFGDAHRALYIKEARGGTMRVLGKAD